MSLNVIARRWQGYNSTGLAAAAAYVLSVVVVPLQQRGVVR